MHKYMHKLFLKLSHSPKLVVFRHFNIGLAAYGCGSGDRGSGPVSGQPSRRVLRLHVTSETCCGTRCFPTTVKSVMKSCTRPSTGSDT